MIEWFSFNAAEWSAIALSLKVAFWAMLCSLPFGIFISFILARGKFWGKAILNGLVHLPLVMPPVVTGYLLLYSFGKRAPMGQFLNDYFGLSFSFHTTAFSISCSIGTI